MAQVSMPMHMTPFRPSQFSQHRQASSLTPMTPMMSNLYPMNMHQAQPSHFFPQPQSYNTMHVVPSMHGVPYNPLAAVHEVGSVYQQNPYPIDANPYQTEPAPMPFPVAPNPYAIDCNPYQMEPAPMPFPVAPNPYAVDANPYQLEPTPMPFGVPVDPNAYAAGQNPYAIGPDPYAAGPDPYAAGPDPYAAGPDPYGAIHDPYGAIPHDPYAAVGHLPYPPQDPYVSMMDPYGANQDPYGQFNQERRASMKVGAPRNRVAEPDLAVRPPDTVATSNPYASMDPSALALVNSASKLY